MCADLAFRRIADDVFEISVETASKAQAFAKTLREDAQAEEVVAGLNTVAIRFDPARVSAIETWLGAVLFDFEAQPDALPLIELDVEYGGAFGPDLKAVCAQLELTTEAFIEQHCAIEHRVEMIGFTPGFSYMSGILKTWAIPRLSNPRPRVPAGSIGISAGYTGIYALPGPGGWPLIGRTTARLFDPDAADPFLLAPVQRVKFRPQ